MSPLLDTGLYQIVEGRHGRFMANPNDIYIGRSLLTYGEFSEVECQLLRRIAPVGGVVIEAGANVGAFTVPLAKKVGPTGRVYAFEPQTAVHQLLCANMALNGLHQVQTFHAACGATQSWLDLRDLSSVTEANFGGLGLSQLAGAGMSRIRVERLDSLFDLPRLDLIKADVEGMEASVLEGARELIAQHRPAIYAEAHDPADAPALIGLLLDMDYRLWWHLPSMFNPDNFSGVSRNVLGVITSKNILAVPAERETKIVNGRAVAGVDDHPRKWKRA